MLGPITDIGQDPQYAFKYCSPTAHSPKDINKHRINLNLSSPHGLFLNEQVNKESFDCSNFLLKFSSVGDIVAEICKQGDVTIAKIDVARVFRNL